MAWAVLFFARGHCWAGYGLVPLMGGDVDSIDDAVTKQLFFLVFKAKWPSWINFRSMSMKWTKRLTKTR